MPRSVPLAAGASSSRHVPADTSGVARRLSLGIVVVVALILGLVVVRPMASHFGGAHQWDAGDAVGDNQVDCPATSPDACLALMATKGHVGARLPAIRLS